MRYLATRKIDLANRLGSRALRTDAVESITCGWLSVVAVVSLGVQAISGAWWVDSAGSLAILWFLIKEGREAWQGECCADCRQAFNREWLNRAIPDTSHKSPFAKNISMRSMSASGRVSETHQDL
jgi:hypothetical protein